MKKAWVLSYPLSAQRRLWSDWADAQADLSLRWAHSHFVGFVMSWLICKMVRWKWLICLSYTTTSNNYQFWVNSAWHATKCQNEKEKYVHKQSKLSYKNAFPLPPSPPPHLPPSVLLRDFVARIQSLTKQNIVPTGMLRLEMSWLY